MKRKIRIKNFDGKVNEVEFEVRNTFHFEVQKNTRANVFKPKKGKGSFTRKQKHKKGYEEGA